MCSRIQFRWDQLRSNEHTQKKDKIELREKLKHLKVVEFRWFGGRQSNVELVMSVLDNAPNIETLTFNTHYVQNASPRMQNIDTQEDILTAKEFARNLSKKHSPKAKLTVY